MESALVEAGETSHEELSIEDGLSSLQLSSVLRPPDAVRMQPASIQQETELQATNWSCEWGSELTCVRDPVWPEDMGIMPPKLLEDSIVQAANTFPVGLGLWLGRDSPACAFQSV